MIEKGDYVDSVGDIGSTAHPSFLAQISLDSHNSQNRFVIKIRGT
jgi:hypothetical protein